MTKPNITGHLRNASNMSISDVIGGTSKLIGNSVSLSFKAIGATIYVANQAVSAGLQVGKSALDEVKEGYTDTSGLLSPSKPGEKPPQAVRVSEPAGSQMEFDFDSPPREEER